MKLKKYVNKIVCIVICTIMMNTILGAYTAKNVNITTEKQELGAVIYEGYRITAYRIRIEGSNEVPYCMEIKKGYPSGQSFLITGSLDEKIKNVVAAGYPNKSVNDLKLNNENEAYFATQIAIWSAVEGYDISKFTGDNPQILEAIRKIYNDGVSGKYADEVTAKAYKTTDESIQQVLVVNYYNLTNEQKAETKSEMYVPQEG